MRGNPEVLAALADLLANEMTAIHQYLLHAHVCADWGFERLAAKFREESAGERMHADELIARILFLEGTPDLNRMHTVKAGASVKEILELDRDMEHAAIAALERGIKLCRERGDNASEDLMTRIIVAEQEDTHWLEAQLELIRQVGEQNYLAQQLS